MSERQKAIEWLEIFYDDWSARTGTKIPYCPRAWPLCEPYTKPEKFYSTFLTLNFSTTAEIKEIHNKLKLVVLRKAYFKDKDIIYNFEYTEHPHIHMLIKGATTQPSKIIRDMARLFKINKNFVDCKNSSDEKIYKTRYEYIKGVKQDSKKAAVEKDKVFRSRNCLEDFYEI